MASTYVYVGGRLRLREKYITDYTNRNSITHKSRRNTLYKNKYGITIEEYDIILKEQDSHCALCPATTSRNGKRLSVDHNHRTNMTRGILCHRCNMVMAFIDNQGVDVLQKILDYSKRELYKNVA